VRKVDIPFVRRHIGTGNHEAQVAQGAGIDHFLVVGLVDAIELAALGTVDQIEKAWKGVAEIKAAPTGMADVEHPLHLGL
jgi:hypothetical protein